MLLAHPGGPFWAKKDEGAWTIPKGLVEPGDDLVATARREFTEETNFSSPNRRIHRTRAGQTEERQDRPRLGIRSRFRPRVVRKQYVRDRMAAEIGAAAELS